MWESVAAWLYDRQLPLERAAIRTALELAALRPADRLLDVATGTGALLRELAELPCQPVHVVGLDSSAGMLRRAKQLPAHSRLVLADARALPFQDASFDVVTVVYLLHLLDVKARAAVLSEVRRVLAPAGRVVTVTVYARRPVARRLLASAPRHVGLIRSTPETNSPGPVCACARRDTSRAATRRSASRQPLRGTRPVARQPPVAASYRDWKKFSSNRSSSAGLSLWA